MDDQDPILLLLIITLIGLESEYHASRLDAKAVNRSTARWGPFSANHRP